MAAAPVYCRTFILHDLEQQTLKCFPEHRNAAWAQRASFLQQLVHELRGASTRTTELLGPRCYRWMPSGVDRTHRKLLPGV